jgi:glycosyltransferase involved in cell wall biosynthesis
MPAVSVVIPSYNHARFISQAVHSVLNQTESDLELIVVDDGSTDNSLQILGNISDPRLKVISQSNQGAHAAINRGLELATSEYLAILNSDDMYHPQRLKKLVGILMEYPETGLIGSYIQVINSEGASLGIKHGYHDLESWALEKPEQSFRSGEELRMVLLTENYWATTSNYVFSRRWYRCVGTFRPLRYAHDWDFALRIGKQARLLMVPEALLSYRIHQTNTINENQAAMVFEICWILAVHLPQAIQTGWFQVRDQTYRFEQLLNSIYVYRCDRILSLMLLQELSQNSQAAFDLLKPEHPLRKSYIEYIQSQLALNSNNKGALSQTQTLSDHINFKKVTAVIRKGIKRTR